MTNLEPMTKAEYLFQNKPFFSKIDLSKGYWQKPEADEDIYKTVFATENGCYEFLKNRTIYYFWLPDKYKTMNNKK